MKLMLLFCCCLHKTLTHHLQQIHRVRSWQQCIPMPPTHSTTARQASQNAPAASDLPSVSHLTSHSHTYLHLPCLHVCSASSHGWFWAHGQQDSKTLLEGDTLSRIFVIWWKPCWMCWEGWPAIGIHLLEETEEGQNYEILFRKLFFILLIYLNARSIEETEEGQNYEILLRKLVFILLIYSNARSIGETKVAKIMRYYLENLFLYY